MIGKTVLSALAVFFLMGTVYGQVTRPGTAQFSELEFFVQLNNSKHDKAEGSKYLFETFRPARINTIKDTYLVRFDIFEDIIELKKNETEIIGLSKKQKYTVSLLDGSSRTFVTMDFLDKKGKMQYGLFERLHQNGHFILYKKARIKFQKAKPMKSSYEQAVPAKFIPIEDVFYISFVSNGQTKGLVELPRKRKAQKSFYGAHFPQVEKFVKSKNLTFDAREDLIRILEYYSKLITH